MSWLREHWMQIALVLLALYCMNLYSAKQNAALIAEAKHEAAAAKEGKARTDRRLAEATREQGKLRKERAALEKTVAEQLRQIAANAADIARLEQEKEDMTLSLRALDSEDALENRFAENFPEVIHATNFGVMDIEDKDGDIIPYMLIPAWFAEVFVNDHEGLGAREAQLAEYRDNERLYGKTLDLKDKIAAQDAKILWLENQKFSAANDARNECDVRYQAANEALIGQLKKPRFELPGAWNVGLCLGAGALGAYGLQQVIK